MPRLVSSCLVLSCLVSSRLLVRLKEGCIIRQQNRTGQDRTKHLVAQHSPRNGSNNGDGDGSGNDMQRCATPMMHKCGYVHLGIKVDCPEYSTWIQDYTVLYNIRLNYASYTILYYAALYYNILYCIRLCYTLLYFIMLYCTV